MGIQQQSAVCRRPKTMGNNIQPTAVIKLSSISNPSAEFSDRGAISITRYLLKEGNQEAHEMEASIFKQLMKLVFFLMQLYFAGTNKGDYGESIVTAKGMVETEGRTTLRY
jgi:hypothetical protein